MFLSVFDWCISPHPEHQVNPELCAACHPQNTTARSRKVGIYGSVDSREVKLARCGEEVMVKNLTFTIR